MLFNAESFGAGAENATRINGFAAEATGCAVR
jgi:hypothetical protein